MKKKSALYHPTAYHEAGHAVMAYFLGVRLKKVTIIPNKDYVGSVLHEKVVRGLGPGVDILLRNLARKEKLARIALDGNTTQKIYPPKETNGQPPDPPTVPI